MMKTVRVTLVLATLWLGMAAQFVSCQKVELPTEETESSGSSSASSGSTTTESSSEESGSDDTEETYDAWSVAEILEMYSGVDLDDGYEEKVTGYIVGACEYSINNAYFTIAEISEHAINTNILIADSKNETDVSRCLPVELKKGSDVRDDANLVDNPDVLGKRIFLYGLVKTYFRTVGLKSVEYHEWGTDYDDTDYSDDEEDEYDSDDEDYYEDEDDGYESDDEDSGSIDTDESNNNGTESDTEAETEVKNDTIAVDDEPVVVPGARSIRTGRRP